MTFNLAYDIGFEIRGCKDTEGTTVTARQIRQAITRRINNLSDDELLEAVGAPFDSYEETNA